VIPAVPRPNHGAEARRQPLQPRFGDRKLCCSVWPRAQTDGEELIADNHPAAEQAPRVGCAAEKLLSRQRRRDSETLIERYM